MVEKNSSILSRIADRLVDSLFGLNKIGKFSYLATLLQRLAGTSDIK